MGAILWELSQCGYDAEWSVISACALGAPHTRNRLFIVAYANGQYGQKRMAVQQNNNRDLQKEHQGQGSSLWSQPAPGPSGMANGISSRLDRIRALGNAVVPQVAAVALDRVLQLEVAA